MDVLSHENAPLYFLRDELHRIAARYGVDELMIVTVTHDREARVRSYELIAEAMELKG
mgnify:CR=1 FL=1